MSSRGENLLTGFIHSLKHGLFSCVIWQVEKEGALEGWRRKTWRELYIYGVEKKPGCSASARRGTERGDLIMDGKGRNGQPKGNRGPHKRGSILETMKDRKHIVKTFKTHKNSLFAGCLVVAIVVLLFGIFSQLQAPAKGEVPSGETSINYSTFLTQVNADNVLAVSINGNGVSALLQKSLTAHSNAQATPKKETPAQQSAEIGAWTRSVGSSDATWDTQTPNIDASRQVYTVLPTNGSSQLMPLLLSKHVAVDTQTPSSTPSWLGMVLKFAPLFFLLVLVTMVLTQGKQARMPQNMQEQMAKFTKRRLRRFDAAQRLGEIRARRLLARKMSSRVTPLNLLVRRRRYRQ